jgi:hypothetical protein
MSSSLPHLQVPWTWLVAGTALCLALLQGAAATPSASESAQALRATHQRLRDKLDHSDFGRPVELDSIETPHGLEGDIYAVVDHPLAEIDAALKDPAHWCEMLALHVNNRRCRSSATPQGAEMLTLFVVRRYDKPVEQAFELPFVYRVASATPGLLSIEMSAASGPLGTSNYRVTLEAVALDERRSFLHFGYGYEHNFMVRLATQAYLATFGRSKVGFTVTGRNADGTPEYIRGPRGLVERNAMRYFLTLDAYLAGLKTPPQAQAEYRQRQWFASTEQYPRQLHEIDLDTYLALKREDSRGESGSR